VERPRRLEDGTALDLPMLEVLGWRHGVKFLTWFKDGGGFFGRAKSRSLVAHTGKRSRTTHLSAPMGLIPWPEPVVSLLYAVERVL